MLIEIIGSLIRHGGDEHIFLEALVLSLGVRYVGYREDEITSI